MSSIQVVDNQEPRWYALFQNNCKEFTTPEQAAKTDCLYVVKQQVYAVWNTGVRDYNLHTYQILNRDLQEVDIEVGNCKCLAFGDLSSSRHGKLNTEYFRECLMLDFRMAAPDGGIQSRTFLISGVFLPLSATPILPGSRKHKPEESLEEVGVFCEALSFMQELDSAGSWYALELLDKIEFLEKENTSLKNSNEELQKENEELKEALGTE